MRVLHLVTWLNRGGIESWLLSMLRAVPRSACQMDICCKGTHIGELADEARTCGATITHCPMGLSPWRYCREVAGLVRSGKYDLVHNHLQGHAAWGIRAALQGRAPVVTSFHNTRFPGQRWGKGGMLGILRDTYVTRSIRYAVRRSQRVVGCSESVIQALQTQFGPLSTPCSVVYYGVSLPPLATNTQRVEFRRELQLMKDAPLVVHVGRFVPQKNHSGVLNVFQRVVQSVPEARLVLVGAGPLLEKTQSQAEALGIRDAVRWLGVRSDVSRLLALCDVFLFPSLFEGFGLAALEANAAGLPVVGSRVPGLTEAVVDNETARLFEATDNLGMAQSVVDLLGNPVIRSALAAKAREHVETRFSIEASADTLVQMYQDSLGDSSSRWSSGNIRQNSPPEDRHARSGGCEHSV